MRMPKDRKRQAELRQITKQLRQLSVQHISSVSSQSALRARVEQYLERQSRYGIDSMTLKAINEFIASHETEMRSDLLRRHTEEDVELGKLRARLDGLIVQYRYDSTARNDSINHLRYERMAALRAIEDRDTPMPAGQDGVEENGYQNGNIGVLAGRGLWATLILLGVLVLAMTADIITFRQVVTRILNSNATTTLVLALAGTTTWVAHHAGIMFRRTKEMWRSLRQAVGGWSLLTVWMMLGWGAFLLRLLAPAVPVEHPEANYVGVGDSATALPTDGSQTLSAVFLLLLYLVTGAIAIAAGYLRPRDEVGQFRRSNRRLKRREPQLAVLLGDAAEFEALRQQIDALRDSRKRQYEIEVDRCGSAARQLRAEAAIIAHRLHSYVQLPWWRRLIGSWHTTSSPAEEPGEDPGPTERSEHAQPEQN